MSHAPMPASEAASPPRALALPPALADAFARYCAACMDLARSQAAEESEEWFRVHAAEARARGRFRRLLYGAGIRRWVSGNVVWRLAPGGAVEMEESR